MREAKNKSIKAKQDRLRAEAEENADISKELEKVNKRGISNDR